jgi:uncharacterized OB-fold protein
MHPSLEKPLPPLDLWNNPFWDACRQSRLIAQRCRISGEMWLPPSPISPVTRTDQWDWVELSGRGRIWSWVVMHQVYFESFAQDVPYNIVQIELDEGPHLLSNLLHADPADVEIGKPVKVVFEQVQDDMKLPKFVLA